MDSSVFHFCVGFVLVTLFAATSRGQSVVDVNPGQTIPNNVTIANGTTVNVNGGTIGLGVNLTSGTLNINSGEVAIGAASIFSGFENTNNIVNVTGGEVGGFFSFEGERNYLSPVACSPVLECLQAAQRFLPAVVCLASPMYLTREQFLFLEERFFQLEPLTERP